MRSVSTDGPFRTVVSHHFRVPAWDICGTSAEFKKTANCAVILRISRHCKSVF